MRKAHAPHRHLSLAGLRKKALCNQEFLQRISDLVGALELMRNSPTCSDSLVQSFAYEQPRSADGSAVGPCERAFPISSKSPRRLPFDKVGWALLRPRSAESGTKATSSRARSAARWTVPRRMFSCSCTL